MSDSNKIPTRAELFREIESGWNELQTQLASFREDQLTRPTDAAGWTVKDHVMHIAVFDQAELAVLERKSKREAIDITPDMWERGEDDEINAVIQQRYHDMPLNEVMNTLRLSHERLMAKLNSMSEADLQLPYSHYQSDSSDGRAIMEWIPWDTVYHYRDHIPWIQAIVEKG